MSNDRKEEINNFLVQLMKTEEGKKMMNDMVVEKEQPIKPLVPKMQEPIKPLVNEIEPKPEPKKKDKENWWNKKFNKNKLKKSTKVAIVFLRTNANVDLLQKETKNGFFSVGTETYHVDKDCIFTLTKDRIPLMVVREWDIIALGTKKWEDEDMREKFKTLETHVLKGIRNAELVKTGGERDSGTITIKQAILFGIVGIVLVAVFLNYL